jgi:hypothetical protein
VRRAVFAKHTGAEVADRAPPDEGLEQADLDTVQTDILAQLLSSALFYLAEDSDLQAIVRMRPEDSMPSTLAECNALLLLGAPAHIIHEHKATHGVAVRPAAPRRAPPRRAPPRARQPPPRPGSPLTPPRPPRPWSHSRRRAPPPAVHHRDAARRRPHAPRQGAQGLDHPRPRSRVAPRRRAAHQAAPRAAPSRVVLAPRPLVLSGHAASLTPY